MMAQPKGHLLRGAVPLSHHFLVSLLQPGDRAVDATCGNGRDTLLLAQLVGPSGRVWAFDVQEEALAATAALLTREGSHEQVTLLACGHERLAEEVSGPLQVVIFNLGYLPGSNRQVTTLPATTRSALDQSLGLLARGGMILVVLYASHAGGAAECAVVEEWAAALAPREWHVWRCRQANRPATAPYLLVVERAATNLQVREDTG